MNVTENWLILETSGQVARVGLARSGNVVRAAELDTARRHARELVPTIDAMLSAESLRPRDLIGIMAARGPGSYTGLRVGLATAKSLAYAVGCQLRAIDTFAAIAEQTPADAHSVWIISDALQNQVYAQRFNLTTADWVSVHGLRIIDIEEWVKQLAAGVHVSGPGVAIYDDRIPSECPRVRAEDRAARIESIFAIGQRVPPLSREELFALEPLYLRGSSAEEKAKQEQSST